MSASVDQVASPGAPSPDDAAASEQGGSSAGHAPLQLIGPTGFVLVLLLLATIFDGAFDVRQWAPPALFAVVALAALVVRGGGAALPRPWGLVAIAGIWGFACWSVLSAAWAQSASDALEGSGRDVLYAAVVTLPLVAIPNIRALRFAGYGVIVGVGALAIGTLIAMLADGPSLFLAGRLDSPVGYRNATALLFTIGFWPLISVMATRGRSRGLRALAFAVAVLTLGLAFLTQSRGILIGVSCGGVVSLLLSPDRVRRTWLAIVAIGLIAIASHKLLTPYDAFDGGHGIVTSGDISTAAKTLVILTLVAFAVGLGMAVFDNGLRAMSSGMENLRRLARIGLVAVAVVAVVGGLVAVGNPVHEVNAKWKEFKANQTVSTGATRFGSTSGQRYDLWRVALVEFKHHPLGGVGRDNYQFGYYRERATDRNLDTAHGLEFEVLSELGAVGALLFVVFVLGVAGTIAGGWRRTPVETRRLAAGLAAGGAVLLGQSMVDWIWRIPGLTSLGLFALATAAALVARSSAPAVRRAPLAIPVRAVAGAGLAVLALGLAAIYLSDHYIRKARAAQTAPVRLSAAKTAAKFNPTDVTPLYLEASALETEGNRRGAAAKLREALDKEPQNVATLGLIGDFSARGGNYAIARQWYARALALNPKDVGLQQLAKTGGRPPGT